MFKAEDLGATLVIDYDHDAESPRDSTEQLGTMVLFHKRHKIGDEHEYTSPRLFLEDLAERCGIVGADYITNDEIIESVRDCGTVILPVYLMDHSGLALSHEPFSCPWDSGQVGWIYVTRQMIRMGYHMNKVGSVDTEIVRSRLISEIEEYSTYIQGDVWCFHLDDPANEHEDSCCGFYGSDPRKNGMADHIDESYHYLFDLLKEE